MSGPGEVPGGLEERLARIEARVSPSEGQAALSVTPDGWTLGLTIGPVLAPREVLAATFGQVEVEHPDHHDAIHAAHEAVLLLVQGLLPPDVPVRPVVISAYGHRVADGYAVNVAVHVPPVAP